MNTIITKYSKKITGVLNCFDRIIITGTLPSLCYSAGMTSYLYSKGIRIFDYPKFAEQFREQIRGNAEKIANENKINIEFVAKSYIRKEDLVQKQIKKTGKKSGLVHIISAMETCSSYKPWYDKKTGKSFLKSNQSKCLHYYFYFIDEYLGLGYIRVPTWCPFKLQIYVNGHNILANELDKAKISYTKIDNAFDWIDDFQKAQEIVDNFDVKKIHKKFDELARKYCPVYRHFNQVYHWSIMQAEYAMDIIFKKQESLQSIYSDLISTAIHTVKPENIVTFLGKKLDSKYQGEIGNNYNIRIEGSRIKHSMGKCSIKMYDKFSKILRIETTTNDVSFFKHYRKVEQRDGTIIKKYAPMKKNIYSLRPLKEIMNQSNVRYLEFVSTIETKRVERKRLIKFAQSKVKNNRNYKGFNLFDKNDLVILQAIIRAEFNIYGFQNKSLRKIIRNFNTGKISRLLKRLQVHGLIKKIGKTYKYYLTKLGKKVIITAMKLKELVLIPALNY